MSIINSISKILRQPVRLYFVVPILVLIALVMHRMANSKEVVVKERAQNEFIAPGCDCTGESIRKGGFHFTQPILMGERHQESTYLQNMKSQIDTYIQGVETSHQAEKVSVYFRRLKDGGYFTINDDLLYNPASMAKVVIMIAYLKDAEDHPGVLDKRIFFGNHFEGGNQPNIGNFRLSPNTYYTVRQLLETMIRYSDNDATLLLSIEMNKTVYSQIFLDLKLKVPVDKTEYFISVSEFSRFFRLLFNSSYFKPELSEYGLKLLTMSDFKDGLRKGVDPTIPIAHKFGERVIGNISQLHEFGIVYVDHDPYLIGVMTSGSNLAELTQIVAEISKISNKEFQPFVRGI